MIKKVAEVKKVEVCCISPNTDSIITMEIGKLVIML